MTVEKKNQFTSNLLPFIRAGIGILSVLFLAVIVSRLAYPFGGGTWESFNWMPATHLLEGKNPYAFAFASPYSMTPYGIVYYALIAVGVGLFGFQMWWGRILSVAALLVCVLAVAKITKKLTNSREAVLVACLAALAMFPAQTWIAIMRSDLIAAAIAFTALWLAFTFEEDKKSFGRVAGIIFLSLAAIFTKHTLLLPVGFIFLRFLQLKKWREALSLASVFAVAAAAGMFLLNYTSSGGYFWQHFTHAQRLPYSFGDAAQVFIEMLKQPTFFFSIVFLLVFVYQNRKQITRNEFSKILRSPRILILLYFPVSLIWAFLSSGRIGGNANYYIEHAFVAAIVCALCYDNFKRRALPSWALAMIILLTAGGAFQQARILRGEYFRWQSLGYYREIFENVGKLTPSSGECISVYPELVVWNGCKFNFDDFEEYIGNWSPELSEIFEREIKAGRYETIVWYDDKLHTKFPNYRLVPMSQKPPEMYFRVYLYVRETPQTK